MDGGRCAWPSVSNFARHIVIGFLNVAKIKVEVALTRSPAGRGHGEGREGDKWLVAATGWLSFRMLETYRAKLACRYFPTRIWQAHADS